MEYQPLSKIYYTSPGTYEEEYRKRFDAPFAQHLPVSIRQYHRKSAYPAFFSYTKDMALLTESVYQSYERFLRTVSSVPAVVLHQFTLLSILDEVKSTNDIEGVRSTRKEIRDILSGTAPHPERLAGIVRKYHDLLTDRVFPLDSCEDVRRLFDEFAHEEIAAENPDHRLDGRIFRKDPVSIESATGKTVHQGLYPEEAIIETMKQALTILHSPDFPLLIRLGLFHYFFAYIHPFYDGNGRTDRFITSYFLKTGFHTLPALRLSVFIKRNRKKYYSLFSEADSELSRGDLTPFLLGFLEIIRGTLDDTTALLDRKKGQLEKYEERIEALTEGDASKGQLYCLLLQASLFYGEGIPIAELAQALGKSRGTVQKRLNEIPESFLIVSRIRKKLYYKLNLARLNDHFPAE